MKTNFYNSWSIPLRSLLIVFLLLIVHIASAKAESNGHISTTQADVTVKGRVTEENGSPMPGVTVSVPGTAIGTATDLNGDTPCRFLKEALWCFHLLVLSAKVLKWAVSP